MDKKKVLIAQLSCIAAAVMAFRFYLVWMIGQVYEKGGALEIASMPLFGKIAAVPRIIPPVHCAAFLLSALILLLIVISFLKRHHPAKVLSFLLETDVRTYLLLIFLSLLVAASYFSPGIPCNGDSEVHIFGSWLASKALMDGEPTLWTNYLNGGTPYFRCYGPLFYYLIGAVNFIFHNVVFSLKFTLALCHVGSGIFMFMLLRDITKDRLAGFIGAASYVFIYFRYFQVAAIGRMLPSVFYLILPLAFYCVERFLSRGGYKNIILLGLSFGGLILTQPGYYSISSGMFLAAYILLRCVSLPERDFTQKLNLSFKLSLGMLYGLAVSSWLWLLMYVEKHPSYNHLLTRKYFPLPAASFKSIFVWSRDPSPNHLAGYIGVSVFLLAIFGLVYVLLKRQRAGMIFGLMCGASFFLTFGTTCRFYKFIPFVYSAHSAGYFLLFVVLFLSILSAYGARQIFDVFKVDKLKGGVIVIAIIALDLVPLSLQDNYPDKPPHNKDRIYGWLNTKEAKDKRVLELLESLRSCNYARTWLMPMYTGMPCINAHGLLIDTIKGDIASHKLSRASREILYLLNIGYVISDFGRVPKEFLEDEADIGGGIWAGTLKSSSPAIAAEEIAPAKAGITFKEAIGMMELDPGRNAAKEITVRGIKSDLRAGGRHDKGLTLKVLGHQIRNNKVRLTVDVSADSYLSLTYCYYPDIMVLVDGKPAKEIFATALGFICIRLPEGRHDIVVKPGFSRFRRAVTVFSVVCFLLGCAGLLKKKRS